MQLAPDMWWGISGGVAADTDWCLLCGRLRGGGCERAWWSDKVWCFRSRPQASCFPLAHTTRCMIISPASGNADQPTSPQLTDHGSQCPREPHRTWRPCPLKALDPDGLVEVDRGTTPFPHERRPAKISPRIAPQTYITPTTNQPANGAQYVHGTGIDLGFMDSSTCNTV
jgi:hypothetical protein